MNLLRTVGFHILAVLDRQSLINIMQNIRSCKILFLGLQADLRLSVGVVFFEITPTDKMQGTIAWVQPQLYSLEGYNQRPPRMMMANDLTLGRRPQGELKRSFTGLSPIAEWVLGG